MKKIDIISFLKYCDFDYRQYIEEVLRIGDTTAIRELRGVTYRRNYERGLLLMAIIHKFDSTKFLEFGTGRGFATACALFLKNGLDITTIDNKSSEQSKNLIEGLGICTNSIFFLGMNSKHLSAEDIGDGFDLVFIDGGHDYKSVKNDYEIAVKCCEKGIIVFDDFRNKHAGVKKFIKSLDVTKILVNTQGWIWKNKMMKKTKDGDGIIDDKEYKSGQVIVPVGISVDI